ncbi:GAF domain-containing protein [Herbiconiux sp. KACC 21604]|uniref:helix-turn-helix domain-containing protein n=1 Tax=unclassified Herbiconiux TaxID=2618217 RepID=UPI0014925E92|nr:GAF domain-containing protein [Herbiconiux sp. SALV-R1]QJU54783.1 GAF domain-containing protein [Herbiconiux sp. SALV-R1]WPO85893.1 GAF domain-containing protein [Herbiconiux sp. KACC 21604]
MTIEVEPSYPSDMGRDDDRRWRRMAHSVARLAVELARPREREQLLERIAEQARDLLGADLAYISLNDDERGETYIHTTVGVMSEEYRSIRMPLGAGVLGKVAGSNKPAQTASYFGDPDLVRSPSIDQAVRTEGVHAILGAPMRIDGTVIGALMVADRYSRVYDFVEVSTLDTLASLGTVVLETNQLISDLHDTVGRLRVAQEQNQEYILELERLEHADATLLADLLRDTDGESLETLLAGELDCAVAVRVDRFDDDWGKLGAKASTLDALRRESDRSADVAVDHATGASVLSVHLGDRTIGAIAAERPLSRVGVQILQRAATNLTVRVLFEEAVENAHRRETDDLVRALLAGRATARDLTRLAESTRLNLTGAARCRIITIDCAERRVTADLLNRQLSDFGFAIVYDDHVCALLVERPGLEAAVDLALRRMQSSTLDFTAGWERADHDGIAVAHRRALAVARSLRRLGRSGECSTPSRLGSVGLLLGQGHGHVEEIVRDTLGPVIDYDATHASHLLRTALTYFEADRNVTRAAKELIVHENTVRQRLEKIRDLLGNEAMTGSYALDTHLALRAWSLGTDLPRFSPGTA